MSVIEITNDMRDAAVLQWDKIANLHNENKKQFEFHWENLGHEFMTTIPLREWKSWTLENKTAFMINMIKCGAILYDENNHIWMSYKPGAQR